MPIIARRPLLTSARSAFSLRSGVLLGEAERIPEVEGHRVRVAALERRVVAGLAAADVVLLAVRLERDRVLAVHLEEADDADDLHLRRRREGVPHVARGARRRDVAERDRRQVRGD